MGVVKGLQAIKDHKEANTNQDYRKVNYLSLGKGESRKIRFVQEFDEESEHYNDDYGTAVVVVERVHPDAEFGSDGPLWWLSMVDRSEDDGWDWAADEGWDAKTYLYINVVDVDTGEVFVWQRSAYSALADQVFESAGHRGSITDTVWQYKKSADSGRYSLSFIDVTDDPLEVDPEDVYDIEDEVLRNIPADEQEEFVRKQEARVAGEDVEDGESVW